ncbi:killer toxin Kp4/SMK [Mariannaea sp. PMI_226]|nr:killer toxin Kp4/SMK [Mariannaea sp. PMI_226]
MRFISILSLVSAAAALGINCRGNTNCAGVLGCELSDIILQVSELDPSQQFGPGDHIACCGTPGSHLCAFTQNWYETFTAGQALGMLQGLRGHGCGRCGSIPFLNNNVGQGEVTVNWVGA